MAYKKKIKTLFNILLTKRREMRMMQMLNEHAHKNRREAGVMPKIINNLEENILSAARRLVAEQGYADDARHCERVRHRRWHVL